MDLTQALSNRRLGKLAKSFCLQAHVSWTNSSSIPFPRHDPPTCKCFLYILALGHVGEYFWTTCALAPIFPTPTSSNTTLALTALHLKLDGYFSLFFKYYEPNHDFKLFFDSFKLMFQRMPHLLTSGFWTHLGLFSPWRFGEWIPSIVLTLFSYYTRSHSTPNCTCPKSSLPLSHDQVFRWSSSHCNGGYIVWIHKPCFMFSIPWNFYNTLFPTPI